MRDAWSTPPDRDALALAQEGVGPPELEQAVLGLVKNGVTDDAFSLDRLIASLEDKLAICERSLN